MAIFVSLVVSLTLTPMMASRFLRNQHDVRHGKLYQLSERGFDAMLDAYRRGLDLVLRWRRATLLVFFVTLGLSIYLFVIIPKGFFPQQDNGMILGDVVDGPGGLHLFYVGFQHVAKAKFLAFTGLALSTDGGEHFRRVQETPILDRAPGRSTIGAVHSALHEDGRWRLWYAVGDDWEIIGGQPFPRYHIRCAQTNDLRVMPREDQVCLLPRGSEYRIGRPRVYRFDGKYVMYFTRGNLGGEYFPGMACSDDGVHWERRDESLGLTLSTSGWDARTLCYPALVRQRDKLLMFYNGNDMGVDGFGVAEAPASHLDGGADARG